MLLSLNRSVLGLVVAVACLCGTTSVAQAQTERYGVLNIQNDTGNVALQFQIKIGDGAWTPYTLQPGEGRMFWHEYKNQKDRKSPPTRIRFNSAIGNNPAFMIEYNLQHYAAPDRLAKYAKKYSFQKNDDNYFDLSSTN